MSTESIEQLIKAEAEKLAKEMAASADTFDPSEPSEVVGKVCVIRSRDAGVHVGVVVKYEGREVHLRNSHRLWSWTGAFTLSEVSQDGITSGKISSRLPYLILLEACEIIPCSEKASEQLRKPSS